MNHIKLCPATLKRKKTTMLRKVASEDVHDYKIVSQENENETGNILKRRAQRENKVKLHSKRKEIKGEKIDCYFRLQP